MEKKRAIGIMGGTFDPIHYGHLVTAEAARSKFGLEKVFFVPSGYPPHKKPAEVSDSLHRYLMTFSSQLIYILRFLLLKLIARVNLMPMIR